MMMHELIPLNDKRITDDTEFSLYIANIVCDRNFNDKQLGAYLGVSEQMIKNWRYGIKMPNKTFRFRILTLIDQLRT